MEKGMNSSMPFLLAKLNQTGCQGLDRIAVSLQMLSLMVFNIP